MTLRLRDSTVPKYQELANMSYVYWPRRQKTCLRRFANNKGADKPAHPRSMISAFVIRLLECIIT